MVRAVSSTAFRAFSMGHSLRSLWHISFVLPHVCPPRHAPPPSLTPQPVILAFPCVWGPPAAPIRSGDAPRELVLDRLLHVGHILYAAAVLCALIPSSLQRWSCSHSDRGVYHGCGEYDSGGMSPFLSATHSITLGQNCIAFCDSQKFIFAGVEFMVRLIFVLTINGPDI
jgi:hypothetical protein